MTSEEKISVFQQAESQKLDDTDDFIPILIVGLSDNNTKVKKLALCMTTYAIAVAL